MAHRKTPTTNLYQQRVGAVILGDALKQVGTMDFGLPIAPANGSGDAFGRMRMSETYVLLDAKLVWGDQPLFWSDGETSGGSTSSTHNANKASVTIGVTGTAGTRTRQTYQYMSYQPGKSQLVMMTFTMGTAGTGVKKRVGLFDDDNGLFLENDEGTIKLVRRTNVTGTATDNKVAQSAWNLDPMDGTGPSEITLDITKAQILVIDFEWLGVGRVRYGFNIEGHTYYVHENLWANEQAGVFMSTPNLPIRYQILQDGTGSADSMECICAMVASEGGQDFSGSSHWVSNEGTAVAANTANSLYALLGMRVKAGFKGIQVDPITVSVLTETNDDYEWQLILNPTISDTAPTFSDVTNQPIQRAVGAGGTANIVSGGYVLAGGYGSSGTAGTDEIHSERSLGFSVSGTADEVWLCARPLGSNSNISGGITYHAHY